MPNHDKARATVVYMARSTEKDISNLTKSLKLLDRFFNQRFGYPVIVFHEDFTEKLKADLQRSTTSNLNFVQLEFNIPNFIPRTEVPDKVLGRFGIGYRHMCRFFGGRMYLHPSLANYDWYWRLDTDSFLRSPIEYDVFKYMEANRFQYGYMVMLKETPAVVSGLWQATQEYMEKSKTQPKMMGPLTTEDGGWNLLYYYNNFEICSLNFGRSEEYQSYFDYLDQKGGIYKYRWGDAPIRTLAVGMLLSGDQIHCFSDIGYSHAGYYSSVKYKIQDRISERFASLVKTWR